MPENDYADWAEQNGQKKREISDRIAGIQQRINRNTIQKGKEALEQGRPLACDLSSWLTKQEACGRLGGISERTLDRMVERHEIERRPRPRPGRSPEAVHNPKDVEAKLPRNPYVMPAEEAAASTGSSPESTEFSETGDAVTTVAKSPAIPAIALLTEYRRLLAAGTPAPVKLWLTVAEALEYSGLTKALLRRLVKDGRLPGIKDRSVKIRRADLEALTPAKIESRLSGAISG